MWLSSCSDACKKAVDASPTNSTQRIFNARQSKICLPRPLGAAAKTCCHAPILISQATKRALTLRPLSFWAKPNVQVQASRPQTSVPRSKVLLRTYNTFPSRVFPPPCPSPLTSPTPCYPAHPAMVRADLVEVAIMKKPWRHRRHLELYLPQDVSHLPQFLELALPNPAVATAACPSSVDAKKLLELSPTPRRDAPAVQQLPPALHEPYPTKCASARIQTYACGT